MIASRMAGQHSRRKHLRHHVVGLVVLGISAASSQGLALAGPVSGGPFAHPRLERSSFTTSSATSNGAGVPARSSHGFHARHGLRGLSLTRGSVFVSKCVGVLDGDTIYIDHDGQIEKVNLWGIDCPELGQPYGLQARQYTASHVLNQPVRVHIKGRTSRGRLFGWIDVVGGSTLNEDLVANGLAWWSSKVAKDEILLPLLQDTARQDKRGLWADKEPVSPTEWRRTHG